MAPNGRQSMWQEMREMGIDPMGELRELGYEYRDGCLYQVGTTKRFEFQDLQHYEALAQAVAEHVPLLLEEEGGLVPVRMPLGAAPGQGCPIYVSEDFENAERLLLIIQGKGLVRAGVWGCRLCINDCLDRGSMLHCVRTALASGYGVIVFNPNENTIDGEPVLGSETFERHVAYVIEKVVSRCAASNVDVLAHSHGGRVLLGCLGRAAVDPCAAALADRIHRIAFTDTYHGHHQIAGLPASLKALFVDPARVVNFVPHPSPLGTRVQDWCTQEYNFTASAIGCVCLSAGVEDHASTNYAAMSAIFEFFNAQESMGNLGVPSNEDVREGDSTPPSSVGSAAAFDDFENDDDLVRAHVNPIKIDRSWQPPRERGQLRRISKWFKSARHCRRSVVESFGGRSSNFSLTRC